MQQQPVFSFARLHTLAVGATVAAACTMLAACSDKPNTAAPAQTDAVSTQQAASAGTTQPPVAEAAPATPVAPEAGRKVAVNAQASSPMGLTVRVKQVELAADATILTVSISLGGDQTIFTSLVDANTYLLDEAGNRLMPKLPEDNRFLRVRKGETLEGELVFMGALPANARQVELVINEGNAPDNTSGPGLKLSLPISAA
jgi:hypothetical protein